MRYGRYVLPQVCATWKTRVHRQQMAWQPLMGPGNTGVPCSDRHPVLYGHLLYGHPVFNRAEHVLDDRRAGARAQEVQRPLAA